MHHGSVSGEGGGGGGRSSPPNRVCVRRVGSVFLAFKKNKTTAALVGIFRKCFRSQLMSEVGSTPLFSWHYLLASVAVARKVKLVSAFPSAGSHQRLCETEISGT